MSYEIEVKAWVTDPVELQKKLDQRATFLRHFDKHDVYFEGEATYHSQPVTVRIRQEDESSVCTFKERQTIDGVEHNREWEFSIGDADAMETLLHRLGLSERIRKRKSGVAYRFDELLLELSEVGGLGHFLEVELLVDSSADETTQANAKKRVQEVLTSFDIPDDRVESRPYMRLREEKAREERE